LVNGIKKKEDIIPFLKALLIKYSRNKLF